MRAHLIHVSATKEFLLALVKREGAKQWLINWPGTTEEAIEAITADSREFFTFDPTCDRRAADGHCLGHDFETDETRMPE